jgi:hypothetical protein
MFTFIKRAIQACQSRQAKEASSGDSYDSFLQQLTQVDWKADYERRWQQILADAHAAAAFGEGPQPWDRDWFEYQLQGLIDTKIMKIASFIGWHRTQDFLEVLNWARASPQGQRALALAGDDNSPWQGALEMIKELEVWLSAASHLMLENQAHGLGYSDEALIDLWEALENY